MKPAPRTILHPDLYPGTTQKDAKAEALLNQSQVRLAKIQDEILEAKKLRTQFEMKVRYAIDAHLQLIEITDEE